MLDPTSSPHHEHDNLDDEEGSGGHPLFPRAETETGPDRRRFDWIQVVRYLPDGTREVCPKLYKGSELRSWQQIVDESGGGCTYQLGGQTTDHRFTAWSAKAYFASPPLKSFGGGPWMPRQDSSNVASFQQPQSTHDMLLITLVKLLADRRDPPPPPPPPPNPVEMFRECAALINGANRGPNTFEVIKEIVPLFNRGDNTSRAMQQGIDLAREIYKNAPAVAAAPARSNGDDIGDIMNIFKMITAVRPAAPAAPAAAPAPAQAPQQQQNAFAPPCPPPPGYGWMYTQQGWVAFPIAMTTHSPAPIPQTTPAPAPVARAVDEDVWLASMLANPETRAKLQALLAATSPAPAPAPHAAAPAPVPAPPAAPVASGAVSPVQAPPGAPQTPASPAHALSDILTASGWSLTPQGETPPAWHYTKIPHEAPVPTPIPAPAVSPAEQASANSFEIPADVPMDDELRAMLAEPAFQELATSVMPPEAQGEFAKLVQQNALRLQETAEA